jgi:hypothetical protein
MKTLKTTKIAGFCLLMMIVLTMMADPVYFSQSASAFDASPYDESGRGYAYPGDDRPSPVSDRPGLISVAGSPAVQRAREAAKRAFNTSNALKPGTEDIASDAISSSASKPLKVGTAGGPLGNTFYNKNISGINPVDRRTQSKGAPSKEATLVRPDTTPVPPASTINDEEKSDTRDMTFEPVTSLSKENMETIDGLKAIINDLERSGDPSNSSRAKEMQDQLTKIADMMNSNQRNLNMPDKDAKYASVEYLFKGLEDQKMALMMKYEKATEPYYDNVRSLLVKNIKIIQNMAGMTKKITEEEIKKMPRNEIDKILEKLRKSADKTFETEYILQQEAKYRKENLEPNLKKLTDGILEAVGGFTKRVSEIIK